MRRVLLFAALLSLLGLTTAFADTFSTNTEDVASFTTDVSVSVPGPTPFPNTIYITGGTEVPPGDLALMIPVNNNVTSKLLVLSTEPIDAQADQTKFFAWESPVAPPQGFSLNGDITLNLEQKDGGANRMTAALFSCPEVAPTSTVTTGSPACSMIAVGVSPAVGGGNGFLDRTVQFDNVSATVPAGSQLRLKIVNRARDATLGVLSTMDFTVQWGFLPARQSKLVIVP
ncbi:MAG: hypothetical protein ABWZ52_12685 [Acidimicrobiales bacterium]